MSECEPGVPSQAKCVVIGAGIVGNCLVGHLARLGWTDLVLVDKGPLPNPGGSTGHASNFIFPTDHNKEMAMLTLDSQRQYTDDGAEHDVRRDRGRPRRRSGWRSSSRRMTSAKAWGIDARLFTPEEVQASSSRSSTPTSSSAASTRRASRWSTRSQAGR